MSNIINYSGDTENYYQNKLSSSDTNIIAEALIDFYKSKNDISNNANRIFEDLILHIKNRNYNSIKSQDIKYVSEKDIIIKSLEHMLSEKDEYIASLEKSISKKDEELLELRKQLAHANEELAELKNKKSLRSEKHRQVTEANRQKAVEANKRKGMNTGALILAYHFDHLDIEGIIEVMRDYNCINVGRTLIYNTLSVRKDEDRERILSLYKGFPDYFSNVSEEEVIAWFEQTRIKKLHLLSKEEFIEKYGTDKLPDPDKYVSGEYYSQPK